MRLFWRTDQRGDLLINCNLHYKNVILYYSLVSVSILQVVAFQEIFPDVGSVFFLFFGVTWSHSCQRQSWHTAASHLGMTQGPLFIATNWFSVPSLEHVMGRTTCCSFHFVVVYIRNVFRIDLDVKWRGNVLRYAHTAARQTHARTLRRDVFHVITYLRRSDPLRTRCSVIAFRILGDNSLLSDWRTIYGTS